MTTLTHAAPIPRVIPRRRRRQWVVWLPVALACLAYWPYCGYLSLVAVCVWVATMTVRRPWAIVLLTIPLLALRIVVMPFFNPELPPCTPACIHRPYANLILANYGLPVLPPAATRIRISNTGFFVRNVYVAFDGPEAAAHQFRRSLKRGGDQEPTRLRPGGYRSSSHGPLIQLSNGTIVDLDDGLKRLANAPDRDAPRWYRREQTEIGWGASYDDLSTYIDWEWTYDEPLHRTYFHLGMD